MITKDEIQELLHSTETYRVERTVSTGDMDKFQEAICAFANDMPNSRKKGYLILGAHDDGRLSGLKVTDDLLKKISAIRSNGNILPIPVMSVESFTFPEGDLLIAEVQPSDVPPVRYRGRVFIRIGPRRDIATEAEERILSERRTAFMATFDARPCFSAKIGDIDTNILRDKYLTPLLGKDLVGTDSRTIEEQMSAVGMYDTDHQCPTNAAIVLFGHKPRRFLPGLYVQYVKFKGEDVTSEVENELQLEGNYCTILPRLESLLELSVIKKKPVFVSLLREEMVSNYPYTAIRELLLNACMHRDLQSNTPLRFYEFANHLEILNAGGLYGNARPENFPRVNDYRNPLIASAMKTMGYVNMFNRGVGQVQEDLQSNGNPPADFNVNLITAFKVDVKIVSQKSSFHTTTTNVVDNVVDSVVKDVVNGVVKIDISQLTDRQINILEFMVQYPTITAKEMSQRLSMASRTIQRDIAILTKLGRVVREGGRYDGTWRVITKPKELTHEI